MEKKDIIIPTLNYSVYSDNYIFQTDDYLKSRRVAIYPYINPNNIFSLNIDSEKFYNEEIEQLYKSLKRKVFITNEYKNAHIHFLYYDNCILFLFVSDGGTILEESLMREVEDVLSYYGIYYFDPLEISMYSKLNIISKNENYLIRDIDAIKIPVGGICNHFVCIKQKRD